MRLVSIIDSLAKLMSVKSLVTIALTIGFIVQACRNALTNDYMSVYLVVISFYFGTQYQKGASENEPAAPVTVSYQKGDNANESTANGNPD